MSPLPCVARARINEWRGSMIDGFATAEQAVIQTLAAIAQRAGAGPNTKLPYLFGARFEALAKALDSLGPACTHARGAAESLARFRRNEHLRAALCHGGLKVALTQDRQWVAIFRICRTEPAEPPLAITEPDAALVLAEIRSNGRDLSSRLGQVRRAIREAVAAGAVRRPGKAAIRAPAHSPCAPAVGRPAA